MAQHSGMDTDKMVRPNPDLLTLRQLEMLSLAAVSNSFSAAAKRLGISQPTLSAAIARIEQLLGARLFDRTTRKAVLTPQGELFAAMATEVVATYRAGSRRLRGDAEPPMSVTFVAQPSIAASIVPEAIADLMQAHTDASVKLIDCGRKRAMELVVDRLADFAIVTNAPDLPDLRREMICRDSFMVVSPPGLPIARQDEATWSDLANTPFALVGVQSVRAQIEQAWVNDGCELRPRFAVEQVSTALALASANLCCTLLPRLYITPALLGDLRAIPFRESSLKREIQSVRRNDRPLSPLAAQLLDNVRRKADRLGHATG
jgi:LysR family transcriptional regulator, carnitine catabolism transcriptional activator